MRKKHRELNAATLAFAVLAAAWIWPVFFSGGMASEAEELNGEPSVLGESVSLPSIHDLDIEPVREWTARENGRVLINGYFLGDKAACPQDLVATTLRNNEVVWSNSILIDNSFTHVFALPMGVSKGDSISFIINNGQVETCDMAFLHAEISYE